MSITIVATPGAANANSLADEAEFIAFAATLLNVPTGTTVSGSTCTETEKKAMLEAARELSLLSYNGTRTDATQAQPWPREFAPNPDLPSVEHLGSLEATYFDSDVVPTRMKNAQIEYALAFLTAGTTDIAAADPNQGVIRKKTDVLETEWASPYARARGLDRFPRVMRWLHGLLSETGGGLTLVRV